MQGYSSGNRWSIAFNRLSILDVSEGGMQPFTFDGVTVFANGEIYNYKELKTQHRDEYRCESGSDVEIIPFLYRKYGIRFLQMLNGMFSMVIVDEKKNRRYLIRDRYGKKPLFYKKTKKGLYFASELKALKLLIALEPDKTNIALNFLCWFLVQPLTLYKDTFNVNPGAYLDCDEEGGAEEVRWYAPSIHVTPKTYEDIRDNFSALYRNSIGLRLRSDVPVGIFLSGGLDSTSMAFVAKQLGGANVTAFTADIENKESFEGNNTDVEVSARLCKELDWINVKTKIDFSYFDKNIVKIISNYEEIFVNSGVLVFYALAERARNSGVKVVLSGVGGDELFGGYPWQSRIRAIPQFLARIALSKKPTRNAFRPHKIFGGNTRLSAKLARVFRLFFQTRIWHAETLCGCFDRWMPDVQQSVEDRIDHYSHDYFRCSMQAVNGDLYNQCNFSNVFSVIGAQNNFVDMACMFSSVENRSPMLDFQLFEYMMSVPDAIKNSSGPKGLLRKILSEFMPDYVVQAKKSGPTMPLHLWFEEVSIREDVTNFIARNISLIAEYVSESLAKKINDDPQVLFGSRALPVFAILSFLIWAKINIENSIEDTSVTFIDLIRSGK